MIKYEKRIDIFAGAVPPVVYLSQYDSDFTLEFELYSSQGEFTLESGTTVAIRGTKKDGNGYSADATLSGTKVTVAGDQQMTACAGEQQFELTLYKGEKELNTCNFILDVEPAAMDANTVPSESVIQEIGEAVTAYLDEHNIVIDPTLTQEGKAADAKATGDEIAGLKADLSDIATIDESLNLLNPANLYVGHYWHYQLSGGKYIPLLRDDEIFACGYVDVENGKNYTISYSDYNAYNVNADGYITGYASQQKTSNVTLDTTGRGGGWGATGDTVRIYFSWKIAHKATDQYMVVEGSTMPSEYEPYGSTKELKSDVYVSNEQVKTPVYYVNPDGSGDYTKLMDAFVDLADDTSNKIIYVASGVYDIYDEIGGDDFVNSIPSSGASYWDYITIVPKNTKVVGIGGVVLEYLPESVPEVAATFISPINISDGDVDIENIKIICKNCRYGIHDQTREDHPNGYNHTYKNVSVLKDSASGITGMAQAFGGGLTQGATLVFENCTFQSYRYAFSFHNAHNGFASIVIKNCAFKNLIASRGSYSCVRFGNTSGVQTHINVNISGSYLNDGISIGNETSAERPNAYDLTMVNCIGDAGVAITSATNIYPPQIFN